MTWWMDETENSLAPVAKGLDIQPESFIGSAELELLVGCLIALSLGGVILKLSQHYIRKLAFDKSSNEYIVLLGFLGVNTPQRRVFASFSFLCAVFSSVVYIWAFQPLHYHADSKLITSSGNGGYSVESRSKGDPCPGGVFVDDWAIYCIDDTLAKKSEQDFASQTEAKKNLLDFRQDRFAKTYYIYRSVDLLIYAFSVFSVSIVFVLGFAIFFQFCIFALSISGKFLNGLKRFLGWIETGRF
jgi:hypothetical protein